jgi:hypothetical protein
VSFRAEEFLLVPWPQAQKDAFLHQQFRLQHHHFVTHFAGADFWIVERALPSGSNRPVHLYQSEGNAGLSKRKVEGLFCNRREIFHGQERHIVSRSQPSPYPRRGTKAVLFNNPVCQDIKTVFPYQL